MTVVLLVVLLILLLGAGWLLTVAGMPGNWLMAAATTAYVWLVPRNSAAAIGWGVVVAVVVLAGLGEVVELAAGALGVAKAGGGRRGALLALLGSMVGSAIGIVVGLPIPVIGSLAAAVLFAALGAMVGAVVGERWAGGSLDKSLRVGRAAFWARLAGTLGKILAGAVIVAVVLAALVL
jgi:uncharacterized protein